MFPVNIIEKEVRESVSLNTGCSVMHFTESLCQIGQDTRMGLSSPEMLFSK